MSWLVLKSNFRVLESLDLSRHASLLSCFVLNPYFCLSVLSCLVSKRFQDFLSVLSCIVSSREFPVPTHPWLMFITEAIFKTVNTVAFGAIHSSGWTFVTGTFTFWGWSRFWGQEIVCWGTSSPFASKFDKGAGFNEFVLVLNDCSCRCCCTRIEARIIATSWWGCGGCGNCFKRSNWSSSNGVRRGYIPEME